ncbi:MAG TPA: hypothetical protein VF595_14080 [Tepidisphaeraceae bacterium]
MAIVLIGLLATILAAVAGRAVVEQQRSALAGDAIQSSRLLAAAAEIAREQVRTQSTRSGPVETPLGHVTLSWQAGASEPVCDAEVRYGRSHQWLTFEFAGGRLTRVR